MKVVQYHIRWYKGKPVECECGSYLKDGNCKHMKALAAAIPKIPYPII